MGDIIIKYQIRSHPEEKPKNVRCYFDTGSSRTFVKHSIASHLVGTRELSHPRAFFGFGNGSFIATDMIEVEFKLLNLWVPHLCYVVPDETLDPDYDVLVGHDFMQIYDVHLLLKDRKVLIQKNALKMALRIR
ncbi:MAG: retroviral-like aspartic protease [Ignavibacteriae bacterium]|nr:retroviral-like aspartic protease [Ignavibacteriota bacterium]